MEYRNLRSMSFENSEIYEKEYARRFAAAEAVHIPFAIGENEAFFLANAEVFSYAYKIAVMDKDIALLCDSLPEVALRQYSVRCMIDEIVLTNNIEGVHSSRQEIGEVLDILENQVSERRGKKSRFFGLVNKYRKFTDKAFIPLNTCEDIRSIYDEIFLDEVIHENPKNSPDGKLFRRNSVYVFNAANREVHKGLFPEEKIIQAMTAALSFLREGATEKLFRICLFHYLFEYIHPFYDGNGRLGRLLFSYGLSETLTPLVAFRISATIAENISDYYKAFKICNDPRSRGELTPFLVMQLNMILHAMEELKLSLCEKTAALQGYTEKIKRLCRADSQLEALYTYLAQASLFSESGISAAELAADTQWSNYILRQNLAKIPAELLLCRKKGNRKFYSLLLDRFDSFLCEQLPG